MRVLVVGGSGSGKSAYAERLACGLSPVRTYAATMGSAGAEAQARIARHRKQRAGLGFQTLECPRELPIGADSGSGDIPHDARSCCTLAAGGVSPLPEPNTHTTKGTGVALLEDVGNLVANALFADDGGMLDPAEVLERLEHELVGFSHEFEHVVVVGNEAGSQNTPPGEGTLAWVRMVGSLCCYLAARFDVVVEVTTGIPIVVKGCLP